jgi:uncharacterized C2H2 Zn-finger protein
MPRPRSKSTTRKTTARKSVTKKSASTRRASTPKTADADAAFVCPECGKTFSRAASLGAHRNRAHGITGRSTRRPKATSRKARNIKTGATRARIASATPVNRDALLSALFPNGIPARESVIRDVNAWLDQAERLAKQR